MYEVKKKIGKVLTSKSVGTGPSSYEKIIYRAAVSQRLRNTAIGHRGLFLSEPLPLSLRSYVKNYKRSDSMTSVRYEQL